MNLNNIGEFGLIKRIAEQFSSHSPGLNHGIGDDCAVFADGFVISTDLMIENVHFLHDPSSYHLLGRKALAVNLSDIAAMGASPLFFLLSIAIPKQYALDDIAVILTGIHSMAEEFGIALIGGDTTGSHSDLMISITVIGQAIDQRYITRKGARPGDLVQVSGPLGSSAAGLAVLTADLDPTGCETLITAHLNPIPRIKAGIALSQIDEVHAMIDISDGLTQDLGHILKASETGAELILESIPVHDSLLPVSQKIKVDPFQWILTGGEDYELCWTVAPEAEEIALNAVRKTGAVHAATIGRITTGRNITVRNYGKAVNIAQAGFNHFGVRETPDNN